MKEKEKNKEIKYLRDMLKDMFAIFNTILIKKVGEEKTKEIIFNSREKAKRWYFRKTNEYSEEFNNKLKWKIKKRDGYKCTECGGTENLLIHHIDYDKSNCEMDNLITLCRKCHYKTMPDNGNRWRWILLYSALRSDNIG